MVKRSLFPSIPPAPINNPKTKAYNSVLNLFCFAFLLLKTIPNKINEMMKKRMIKNLFSMMVVLIAVTI
jgi:hypothetical protein